MKKIAFAFAAVTAMIAVPAFAQDSAGGEAPATTTASTTTTAAPAAGAAAGGSGLELGLRLGYGLPMGDAVRDGKLGDVISGKIPIWVDVGYRVNPNIYVGAFFAYGIASINKDKVPECSLNGVDCSGSTMDLGVMAAYHIMPDQSFDPWVGLGVGYEIAKLSASAGGQSQSTSYSGLTFANIQVGGDYRVNNNLGIGPFVSFALGQYSSCSVDNGSCSIADKAMHEWLTIGVRGTYGIW